MSTVAKISAWVALAAILGSSFAFAETTQCRSIQSRKDRNACYERQEAAKKTAAHKPESTKMGDSIDRMKVEDDRLTKRLQGICRGC